MEGAETSISNIPYDDLIYKPTNDPYKSKVRSGKKPNYSESEMKTIKKRRNKNKAAKKARKKNRR